MPRRGGDGGVARCPRSCLILRIAVYGEKGKAILNPFVEGLRADNLKLVPLLLGNASGQRLQTENPDAICALHVAGLDGRHEGGSWQERLKSTTAVIAGLIQRTGVFSTSTTRLFRPPNKNLQCPNV